LNVDAGLLLEDCRCPSCERFLKAGACVFSVDLRPLASSAFASVEVCYYCLAEALRGEADEIAAGAVAPENAGETEPAWARDRHGAPLSWAALIDTHHKLIEHQAALHAGEVCK